MRNSGLAEVAGDKTIILCFMRGRIMASLQKYINIFFEYSYLLIHEKCQPGNMRHVCKFNEMREILQAN
ncbi:MAG: hypothetical protein D6E12_12325 [Desulfovibrio sp.]|nr:MAG: hypothetical protein D6E12_12325 [Desulfovibrio sp.]